MSVVAPKVSDAKFCANCVKDFPASELTPHRPSYHPQRFATPKFCPDCLPEGRKSRYASPVPYSDPETGKIDVAKWAANRTDLLAAEYYFKRQRGEAHRGMIRTEPWPEPTGRVPSFVWELKPNITLWRELAQGMRYLKTNW